MRTSESVTTTLSERVNKYCLAAVAALGLYAGFPSTVEFQDIASRGIASDQTRWLAHVSEAPGQMVLASAYGIGRTSPVDQVLTGSIANSSILEDQNIQVEIKADRQPQQINRKLKGARVVSETSKKPPQHFSAGSIVKAHTILRQEKTGQKIELAFVKPKPQEAALRVASVFHQKPDPDLQIKKLPVMVASLVKESENSVTAYAPEPELLRSPFAAILKKEKNVAAVPKLGKGDHKWAAGPLPKHVFSKKQQRCLAEGIYFEARGESVRGQAAVAQVILNRVRNPTYPNTVCGVVYQNKKWRNRCQFSFACDRIRDRVRDQKSWKIAKHVAAETSSGRIWFSQVGSATHYHASYVKPKWARSMRKVGRIGLHLFYRTKNGGWS